MARIFISYRRRDSAYVAGILRDALQAHFGSDSVFLDLDNIPFGVDFRQHIASAVGHCDVLLVLIGDQWLQLTDDQGRRQIEGLSDYVRIEIESALKRDIPVVPVLIDEAKMPGAGELPDSIRDMAFRNAAEIRAGRDQKHQIERLISDLAEHWRAKVSGKGEQKLAAPDEEKPPAPEPRKTIARPKVRGPAKTKPKVTELASPKLTSVISEAELDRRAAFLEKVEKAFRHAKSWIVFWGDAVPFKKAHAATAAYAPSVSQDDVIFLYDSSVFHTAKTGFLLTVDGIYWGNSKDRGHYRYGDIHTIDPIRDAFHLRINRKTIRAVAPDVAKAMTKLVLSLRPELQVAKSPPVTLQEAAFLERVRKAFNGITDDGHLYLRGAIPPEKAEGATKAYAPGVSHDAIMLLYAWEGGKEGLLLTVDGIYCLDMSGKPCHWLYADIEQYSVTKNFLSTILRINKKDIPVTMGPSDKIAQAVVNLIRDWKTLNPGSPKHLLP
jgi:hypothetical protein